MHKADEALVARLAELNGLSLDSERVEYLTPQINQALEMYQQMRPVQLLDEPAIFFNPMNFVKGGVSE